ncbi:hypothetical protein C0992_005804 [Termitomyces sp. T32_za158]|nr:hypothetical protein C0992_005804 [Termitomyces sp. T32_za158]
MPLPKAPTSAPVPLSSCSPALALAPLQVDPQTQSLSPPTSLPPSAPVLSPSVAPTPFPSASQVTQSLPSQAPTVTTINTADSSLITPNLSASYPPPPLPTSVPETSSPTEPTTRKSNSKPLKAKDGVTTARNLYLIDYLTEHPEATEGDFTNAWKFCDALTKEKYSQLSKEQTRLRKKGPKVAISENLPHAALSSVAN